MSKKFSLILATLHRVSEVENFLHHLNQQTYRNFELIVVDQNTDDRLARIIGVYESCFEIKHIRSSPGLSVARNAGLKHITGEVVGFPDDDCWYPPDLLEKIVRVFHSERVDGLSGKSVDESGMITNVKLGRRLVELNQFSVWRMAISITIFLRSSVIVSTGAFDTDLGLGSEGIWGSGEETDFLIRALGEKARIAYIPDLYVYHPDPEIDLSERAVQRAFLYGAGMGYVLRKHQYPWWFVLYVLSRPIAGSLKAALQGDWGRRSYYLASFRGRLKGWLGHEA